MADIDEEEATAPQSEDLDDDELAPEGVTGELLEGDGEGDGAES